MLERPSRVTSETVTQQVEGAPREQTLEEMAEVELSPANVQNFVDLGIKLERLAREEAILYATHRDRHTGSHFFQAALSEYTRIRNNISRAFDGSVSESEQRELYDKAIDNELIDLWLQSSRKESDRYRLVRIFEDMLTQMAEENRR